MATNKDPIETQPASLKLRKLPIPDYDAVAEFRSFELQQIMQELEGQTVIKDDIVIPRYNFLCARGDITTPEDWTEIAQEVIDIMRSRMVNFGIELPSEYDPKQVFFVPRSKQTTHDGQFIEEYNSIEIVMPNWFYVLKFVGPFVHEMIEYLTYRDKLMNGISPRTDKNENGELDWMREALSDSLGDEILFTAGYKGLNQHLGYRGHYTIESTYLELLVQGISYEIEKSNVDITSIINDDEIRSKPIRIQVLEIIYKANFTEKGYQAFVKLINEVYANKGGFTSFLKVSDRLGKFISNYLLQQSNKNLHELMHIFRPKQYQSVPSQGSRELEPDEKEYIEFIFGMNNFDILIQRLNEIDNYSDVTRKEPSPDVMIANHTGLPPYLRNRENPYVASMIDNNLVQVE